MIDDRWFLEQAVPETDSKDRGTLRYDEVCRDHGFDWDLVEKKALELERRGLVRCQEGAGFCWLTKKGWEWLEEEQ